MLIKIIYVWIFLFVSNSLYAIDKINLKLMNDYDLDSLSKSFNKEDVNYANKKINQNYTNKKMVFKIKFKNEEIGKYLHINVLSPGRILIFNLKGENIYKYGYNDNQEEFYPIIKINDKELIIIREGNLRFDGTFDVIEKEEITKINKLNLFILTIFIGSVVYLVLYHFGYFLVTKNKTYIYYILFNVSYTIIVLIFGKFFNYFSNNMVVEENLMIVAAIAAFFLSKFATFFVNFNNFLNKKQIYSIYIFEILLLIFALLNYFVMQEYKYITAMIIDVLIIATLLNVTMKTWKIRKQNVIAKLYLISWIFTYTGIFFLYSYEYFNLFGEYHVIRYSLLIGVFCEMIVNSFGLAYQYKQLALEKNKANLEARDKKRYQNAVKILIHDIATPLTSSIMSIEMLKMKHKMKPYLDDRAFKVLDTIEKANQKIKGILDDTRSYEKEYELSDINQSKSDDIFKEINDLFALKLNEKNIKLVKVGKNIDIPVKGSLLVNNILGNILSNCIKFSHENSLISFSFNETSTYHEIIIKDQGIGMNEEQLHKIRNMVITSSLGTNKEKGTGFGMQIATTLINEFNGTLEINSSNDSENHGSEFIIRFKK